MSTKVGIIITLLFSGYILFTIPHFVSYARVELNKPPVYSSSPQYLVDKVYNFTAQKPYVYFEDNIYFERLYNYFILLNVVSPFTCTMNISLKDPEGDLYELSSITGMGQDDVKEIPFGVALSGDYSLYFDALLTQNITIHILLERKLKCLSNKIEEYEESIIFRNVSKFYPRKTIKSQISVYIEKVSPIAIYIEGGQTRMNHTLIDPQDFKFNIYINETIVGPLNVSVYRFGTATEGNYTFCLTVKSNVDFVNIAYAVVLLGKIGDNVDPDNPEPPPSNETHNNTRQGTLISIPMVGFLGILGTLGGSALVVFIGAKVVKKKNINP
ncbi:MAG: hypothetical protein ACXADU_19065 [Promethearchaeota archaeon]|jgi:hypothetical protein